MECQKTFNAPNKNLDKTDSGASLSVRLKFKEKKNVTSYNESIHRKNKGSGKDSIHSDESNVTCMFTEQGKTLSINLHCVLP